MKKDVTVRVRIPARTAAALVRIGRRERDPRELPNLIGWLAVQAEQVGTINHIVPLAKVAAAMTGIAATWRGRPIMSACD
jgi:hypothetical protein